MATLAQLGPCPPLREALARLREDRAAPPTVCLTFDDGMADNVSLALPILRRYGHHATFFLATGLIGQQRPMFNDRVRLLRPAFQQGSIGRSLDPLCRNVLEQPRTAKRYSLTTLEAAFGDLWERCSSLVDPEGVLALRLMRWDEVDRLLTSGMEIGAHTAHHTILAREDRATRHHEIAESIMSIRARTGRNDALFSFPNGQEGDYDEGDLTVLNTLGVRYALTQHHGWNTADAPPLKLRRHAIGRHCSHTCFQWEVSGAGGPEKDATPFEERPTDLAAPPPAEGLACY